MTSPEPARHPVPDSAAHAFIARRRGLAPGNAPNAPSAAGSSHATASRTGAAIVQSTGTTAMSARIRIATVSQNHSRGA